MAGHAKWQNIMHKKKRGEAVRSAESWKASQSITLAIRDGGGERDPALNTPLASAISVAKSNGIPRAVIDKAITGFTSSLPLSEHIYEIVSPQGVSFVGVSLTENQLRTGKIVRTAVKRFGLKFTSNSLLYRFPKKGVLVIDAAAMPEDVSPFEVAVQTGAEDIMDATNSPDDSKHYELRTEPKDLGTCVQALKDEYGITPLYFDIKYIPDSTVVVAEEDRQTVVDIIETLEDTESMVKVFSDAA